MAKKRDPFSFKFGANAKPKKARKGGSGSSKKPRGGGSGKGNAWRAYIGGGVSNAPIPD